MKHTHLFFLGSGAADWRHELQPKRAFASLMVDGRILIDCTMAALRRLQEFRIEPGQISDVLITHGHSDHFSAEAILALAAASRTDGALLRVHLDRRLAGQLPSAKMTVVPLEAGVPVAVARYQVTPLAANHPPEVSGEQPLHYLFSQAGRCFYYATDGAWMTPGTWRTLLGCRLDAWIVDATIGDGHRGDIRIFEHNSLEMVRIMTRTLRQQKVLKPHAPVILTHLARTLHPEPIQLAAKLRPPFVAAYDGYTYEIGEGASPSA